MKNYSIKDNNPNRLMNLLLVTLNVAAYIITIMLSFFNPKFDSGFLLPHYEKFTKTGELFGFMAIGHVEIVEAGTYGAYFAPGILLISALVQLVGYLLYVNVTFMKLTALETESIYSLNTRAINQFNYLITDDDFRKKIAEVDKTNKKEAWTLLIQERLQKLVDKIPRKVNEQLYVKPELQSKKTKRWVQKENDLKERLTKEWIDENIHKIKIKYPKINVKLIVSGYNKVRISNIAIEDQTRVRRGEFLNKAILAILSLVFVSILVTITFSQFRSDLFSLIKDFIVYTASLVMNIVLGIVSAQVIHKSRVRETEDRLGYITGYVGIDKVEKEKFRIIKLDRLNELDRIKQEMEYYNEEEVNPNEEQN